MCLITTYLHFLKLNSEWLTKTNDYTEKLLFLSTLLWSLNNHQVSLSLFDFPPNSSTFFLNRTTAIRRSSLAVRLDDLWHQPPLTPKRHRRPVPTVRFFYPHFELFNCIVGDNRFRFYRVFGSKWIPVSGLALRRSPPASAIDQAPVTAPICSDPYRSWAWARKILALADMVLGRMMVLWIIIWRRKCQMRRMKIDSEMGYSKILK